MKKHLYLITSTLAILSCFGCANKTNKTIKSDPAIDDKKTVIKASDIVKGNELLFEYEGSGDFTVDWGDGTTEDEHKHYHVYDGTVSDPVVTIDGTFTSIWFSYTDGTGPFASNNLINSVEIGNGITTLPAFAFNGCDVSYVFIPKSVLTIGSKAFTGNNRDIIYCERKESEIPEGWDPDWKFKYTPCYWDCIKHGSEGFLDYVITSTSNGAILTKYHEHPEIETDVVISEKFGGEYVVEIGARAFWENQSLTSVVLPSHVKSIGDSAFSECCSLEIVKGPDTITFIGDGGFEGCPLKQIFSLENVTYVDSGAFYNCALKSFNFSDKLTFIGDYAFYTESHNFRKEFFIPKSVEYVGRSAFLGNNDLTIYCGAKEEPSDWHEKWDEDIKSCRWNCTGAGNYNGFHYYSTTEGATITEYDGESSDVIIPNTLGGVNVVKIEDDVFKDNDVITSVKLPKTLKAIGDNAFYNCSSLKEVVIPKSVETIGKSAFTWSDGLVIYCEALSKPNGWDNAWSLGRVKRYWGYISHDSNDLFNYVTTTKGVTIDKYIGEETEVSIPQTINKKSVVAIADNAFEGSLITSIKLPKTLESIGSYAFNGCQYLEEVIIPNSVQIIGEYAFNFCFSLTAYCEAPFQPEGWDYNWIMNSCTVYWGYESHGVKDGFKYVIDDVGGNINGYVGNNPEVIIPATIEHTDVIRIDKGAFKNNSIITLVKLPKTLMSIGSEAFASCTNLTTIDLTDFTDCYNTPGAVDDAFTSTDCKFKVASKKMMTAFRINGHGWPVEAERYTL